MSFFGPSIKTMMALKHLTNIGQTAALVTKIGAVVANKEMTLPFKLAEILDLASMGVYNIIPEKYWIFETVMNVSGYTLANKVFADVVKTIKFEEHKYQVFTFDDEVMNFIWVNGDEDPDIIINTDSRSKDRCTVYVKANFDLGALVKEHLWKGQRWAWLNSAGFIEPMEEGILEQDVLGDYLGEPSPDLLASQIENRTGTVSALLIGKSGNGKTTLARHALDKLGAKTILIVAGDLIKSYGGRASSRHESDDHHPLDIIFMLKPDAVIIDDIPVERGQTPYALLNWYERLRGHVKWIFSTFMLDDDEDDTGSLYIPGLRPGRVDFVHYMMPPDETRREMILRHYLKTTIEKDELEKLIDETEGLTGAYLKELAIRMNFLGAPVWRDELAMLKRFTPVSQQVQRRERLRQETPKIDESKQNTESSESEDDIFEE